MRARRHLDQTRLMDAPAVFIRKHAYNADRSWATAQQVLAARLAHNGGSASRDDSDGYIPRSVFVDHCRQIIGVALQRAVCTQITNNVKTRKGVGSTRDNMDLCSSLPLTGRL